MPNIADESESPIFDFAPLKAFLESRGIKVGKSQPYEPIDPGVITRQAVESGDIEFQDDGIYVKDRVTGNRHQVFLYLNSYNMAAYGKPRYHICRCSTIEEFIASGQFSRYTRANTDPVPVYDRSAGRKVMVANLPLCRNCLSKIREYGSISSTDFVEILKRANEDYDNNEGEVEVDIFGYTKDWEAISRAYRTKQDFTCEACGLHIENELDRMYLHTHHINGNKIDNRERNLRCLCVRCHANVDANHLQRLTSGANKIIYDEFCRRFPKQ